MKHPFQSILTSKDGSTLITSAKKHIQCYSLKTGEKVAEWTDPLDSSYVLQVQQKEKLEKLNPPKVPKIPTPGEGAPPIYNYIRKLTVSRNGKYLIAVCDSDKSVCIFDRDLKLVKRQPFAKRPSSITTSLDDETIVVADKFGDVYQFQVSDDVVSDEKSMEPILGHVSMLTDILIVNNEGKQSILTADRDEHIRVSAWPHSFIIENWLFGHENFISSLVVPSWNENLLVSGGGDSYINVWTWKSGQLVSSADFDDIVEPYIITDHHLLPERFQNEDYDLKEYSVAQVEQIATMQYIVVLVEATPVLLVYHLSVDGKIELRQKLETDLLITSFCVSNDTIIASVDGEEQVQFFQRDGEQFAKVESKVANQIRQGNVCEMGEKYPLYTINSLKKRAEH